MSEETNYLIVSESEVRELAMRFLERKLMDRNEVIERVHSGLGELNEIPSAPNALMCIQDAAKTIAILDSAMKSWVRYQHDFDPTPDEYSSINHFDVDLEDNSTNDKTAVPILKSAQYELWSREQKEAESKKRQEIEAERRKRMAERFLSKEKE